MRLKIAEDINRYLSDKSLIIPESHLDKVCKKGKGKEACRYIGLSAQGFFCAKNTPLRKILDKENMKAQGNNCDGCQSKSV